METKKRFLSSSCWNPKAKSPEGESHGVASFVAVSDDPMATVPLVWAIDDEICSTNMKKKKIIRVLRIRAQAIVSCK